MLAPNKSPMMGSAPFATHPPGARHVAGTVLVTGGAEAKVAEPLPPWSPCSLGEADHQMTTVQGGQGSVGVAEVAENPEGED